MDINELIKIVNDDSFDWDITQEIGLSWTWQVYIVNDDFELSPFSYNNSNYKFSIGLFKVWVNGAEIPRKDRKLIRIAINNRYNSILKQRKNDENDEKEKIIEAVKNIKHDDLTIKQLIDL